MTQMNPDVIRPIQEIFDAVIDNGFFGPKTTGEKHHEFMCDALYAAGYDKVISQAEYMFAKQAIKDYLRTSKTFTSYLEVALYRAGLPFDVKDRQAIYSDWVNRPNIERVVAEEKDQ